MTADRAIINGASFGFPPSPPQTAMTITTTTTAAPRNMVASVVAHSISDAHHVVRRRIATLAAWPAAAD